MTARFDPVRDSAASPSKKPIPLYHSKDVDIHQVADGQGDADLHRPGRKPSIADLLNDEPTRPSRTSTSGDFTDPQHHDGYDTRTQITYYGSSPASSSTGLSHAEGGYESGPSHRHEAVSSMQRHSSSQSTSSSLDQSLHPYQGSHSSQQHSPSVQHLLNSDVHQKIYTSPSNRPRPRSRGPSFAGGADILSPSNDEAAYQRDPSSSSSQPENRREDLNRHHLSPSQHQMMNSNRHPSQSSGQSYFAVPEVPYRSPDFLRNRKMLPDLSNATETALHSIPSHHLRAQEMVNTHETRPLLLQQPLTPSGVPHYFVHSQVTPRYQSPHALSDTSSRELTPNRNFHPPPPLSPMEVPPTPGEHIYSATHHPSYFTSHDSTTDYQHDRDRHVLRPWSDRDGREVEGAGNAVPSHNQSDAAPVALPPAKKRKKSTALQSIIEVKPGVTPIKHDDDSLEGAGDTKLASDQPKRGRPKGRKSVSNGVGNKMKGESREITALSEGVANSEETKMKVEIKEQIVTPASPDISMRDVKTEAISTPSLISASAIIDTPRTPYRPTKRVSIPTTIRMPVTAQQVDEMRLQCQNSLRSKWQSKNPGQNDGFDVIVANFASQISTTPLLKVADGGTNAEGKRKREAIEREESNAALVAQHYNSRQDQGLGARKQSPILPLRNFNNWVKSVIISTNAIRNGRVLDLGGGKGGDLNKWDKAQIDEYILCDIAEISIQQAESRYRERRYHFNARFFSFDCFAYPLSDNIPKEILEPLFDTVSLQFCLHYGWETVQKAQLMLENVSRYLKPGGTFVGTIPNADLLRSRLTDAMKAASSRTSFGNQYYEVIFSPDDEKNSKCPPFGHKYKFTLLDAVDDVAEYVVDWHQLVSLANQNGLECIFKKTFDEIWQEEGQMEQDHQELARRMRIYPNGPEGLPMNSELWEATSLYIAFAFEKKNRV